MRLRPIKARLGAVRLALESLDRGSAEHASTSMSQSLACMKDAKELDGKISLEQQAELLALNSEIVWASRADAARVTKALQNIKMPDSKRKQRRRGQNYTAFVDYWTSANWDRFESDDLGDSEIRAICLSHLKMLECILPNEPAIKLINSFLLCLSHRSTTHISEIIKKGHLDTLRKDFDKIQRENMGSNHLEILPARPEDFKRERPDAYSKAFPTEGPVKCRLDPRVLVECEMSYQCRGLKTPATLMLGNAQVDVK